VNKFPADDEGDFTSLRRAVDDLQAVLKNREPLTEASAGWILRDRDDPETPAGGVHIYAQGGEFYVRTGAGLIRDIIPPQAAAVAIAANMTSAEIGSAPNSVQYNNLRADVVEVRAQLNALINSLRAAGILLT